MWTTLTKRHLRNKRGSKTRSKRERSSPARSSRGLRQSPTPLTVMWAAIPRNLRWWIWKIPAENSLENSWMEATSRIGWRTWSRGLSSTHVSSCIRTSDITKRSSERRPLKMIQMLVTPKWMSQSEDKKIKDEQAEIRTTWILLLTTKTRAPSLVWTSNLLFWLGAVC